jgi:predicted XRE-type DNA-binding protein
MAKSKKIKADSKAAVSEASTNVFADLGYANAAEHETKARLVIQIAKLIKSQELTQAEAAETLGIDQPKISAMLNGKFRGFSVYRLMHFVRMLGRKVKIVTENPAEPAEVEAFVVS